MINLNITRKFIFPQNCVLQTPDVKNEIKCLSIHFFVIVGIEGSSLGGERIASVAALNSVSLS